MRPLTISQAADHLGLADTLIYWAIKEGWGPEPLRNERPLMIDQGELDRWYPTIWKRKRAGKTLRDSAILNPHSAVKRAAAERLLRMSRNEMARHISNGALPYFQLKAKGHQLCMFSYDDIKALRQTIATPAVKPAQESSPDTGRRQRMAAVDQACKDLQVDPRVTFRYDITQEQLAAHPDVFEHLAAQEASVLATQHLAHHSAVDCEALKRYSDWNHRAQTASDAELRADLAFMDRFQTFQRVWLERTGLIRYLLEDEMARRSGAGPCGHAIPADCLSLTDAAEYLNLPVSLFWASRSETIRETIIDMPMPRETSADYKASEDYPVYWIHDLDRWAEERTATASSDEQQAKEG